MQFNIWRFKITIGKCFGMSDKGYFHWQPLALSLGSNGFAIWFILLLIVISYES